MLKKAKNILFLLGVLICIVLLIVIADVKSIIGDVDTNYYFAMLILVGLVGARGIFAIYKLEEVTKKAVSEVEKAKSTIKNASDSSWVYENLMSRARVCIYKFNEALEKRDISYASGYVSDSLKAKLEEKIKKLIEDGKEIVFENYKIVKLLPVKAIDEVNDEKDLIKIVVQVELFTYIIDENKDVLRPENIILETIERTWRYVKKNGFWVADEIEEFELELNSIVNRVK